MRLTCRYATALVTGLLLLTACNSDDNDPAPDPPPIGGDEDEDDEDDEDNEAVEEEDEEPYAVPDEIDEAYAEEVINVLLEINTEALKIVLEQEPGEVIDPEAADHIAAISDGARRELALETFQIYIDRPEATESFRPVEEIGVSYFQADGILHAEPESCILAVGRWDLTEVATDPPDEQQLFSLGRLDRETTSVERNPTPWQIRDISPMRDADDQPISEDQWDDLEFGDALDYTCEDR
jgi:hypothetical protein